MIRAETNNSWYTIAMSDETMSEDFAHLVAFKQRVQKEAEAEADFFYDRYKSLITVFIKRFFAAAKISALVQYGDGAEQSEAEAFFEQRVKEKYIPQALLQFKPEKITNPGQYAFATYLTNYLRNAVRDLSAQYRKIVGQNAFSDYIASPEDDIIERMEAEERQRIAEKVKKHLTPLQRQIFFLMEQGARQKDIVIVNKKTGKRYSKGYISKEIAVIRHWEETYLTDDLFRAEPPTASRSES